MKKLLLPFLLLSGALLMSAVDTGAQTREERLAEYVHYFASDSLKGREAGSHGAEMARYYIVARYKECGLKPFLNGDFVIPFTQNGKEYANVVGIIEGNSLKHEYIVLGAHFDHLGVKNGQIYPGADDNASGSAALIEIARELRERQGELQRSVIIAAFDAEEKGLYGSNALSELIDATYGIENVKLMMSIDMMGWYRQSGKLILEGTSTIRDGRRIAEDIAKSNSITVETRNFETSVLTATDTQGFAKLQVPTLAVTTGLKSPYHKPGDKADLIDYAGLDKVSGYLADLAAEASSDPAFTGSGRVARKHSGKAPVFECGVIGSVGGSNMRFPDARLTADSDWSFNGGLMGRFNFGKAGLQFNVLFDQASSSFPNLNQPLGKAQKYMQRSVTVPAYLIYRFGDASSFGYTGVGGYYSYAFQHNFSDTDPTWAVNPNQGGMAAVFGMQTGALLMEWSFRWQLNSLFNGPDNARLNYGSYLTLGWVF